MLQEFNQLNQHMRLNLTNITDLMAKEFLTFLWNVAVSQFNAMNMEKMTSELNDFSRSINDDKLITNVVELREWFVSMQMT